MEGTPWAETEVRAAVKAYFSLLASQQENKKTSKVAIYRQLSKQFPFRTPKAFELKFQNISAILYEDKYPFVDGLMPRGNYQNLLKLMVWDYLKRSGAPKQMPWEILVERLRGLYTRGFLPTAGLSSGRYGLTLEGRLGIPPNSSKNADFMGIELKTKHDSSLQTLFSRIPSKFVGCRNKEELLRRFGRFDKKRGRKSLYTSFGLKPDSFGFSLHPGRRSIAVRNYKTTILEYDHKDLERAFVSKHSETAYITVKTRVSKKVPGRVLCRFEEMVYCKGPSILGFLDLAKQGHIHLDFTLSMKNRRSKDHGFLWRANPNCLKELYLESKPISLATGHRVG